MMTLIFIIPRVRIHSGVLNSAELTQSGMRQMPQAPRSMGTTREKEKNLLKKGPLNGFQHYGAPRNLLFLLLIGCIQMSGREYVMICSKILFCK